MDIRKEFLDYFESKGHVVLQSSPLVPDDATLLFTNAGMVQFKQIFTGEAPIPNPPRAATSQTCIRAGGKHNDLENVGYTARHHTFFEMLGNFSFGDYFKEDAIDYAWEFVTVVLGLPKDRLWITIHDSDDEAGQIWLKHVPADKIVKMGDKDNFWQMGDTGPCGPCSEIHFDQGADKFSSEEDYLGGEGDRFLEIWNLVFMQYERKADGTLTPLPKPSIDTGMGLERVTAIKEGKTSNYDSTIFMPLLKKVEEICGKPYEYASGASYRVIADHVRAVSFLLAQGVNFSNEGRGYVMRRILRRAVRHGYLLGLRAPFMGKIFDVLATEFKDSYPYLLEKSASVKERLFGEEERFFATIDGGMELFEKELASTKGNVFSGEAAFKLYDTFGFPLDLTQDMLRQKDMSVDEAAFDAAMAKQKAQSKAAWKGSGDDATKGDFKALLEEFGLNKFVGYEHLHTESKIVALLDENMQKVDVLTDGKTGWVMLDNTPFYAQSGGQAGDVGKIANSKVIATKKFMDLNLSKVEVSGTLKVNEYVSALVKEFAREQTARHHSATHLLHAALRKVLGDSVGQAGSDVDDSRLRFDFTYARALSDEQLKQVEDLVNEWIIASISGETKVMNVDDAKASGAMALFGEKYGDSVRVVSFGDASVELCGGTHIKDTAKIGTFAIVKESGVSAGVRRIEAVCSLAANRYLQDFKNSYEAIASELKSNQPLNAIAKLKNEIKELKLKLADALKGGGKDFDVIDVNGVKLIVEQISMDAKTAIDELKNKYEKAVIMLINEAEDKVNITTGAKGVEFDCGAWIRNALGSFGAKGGGRKDFASGSMPSGDLSAAIESAKKFASENIK